MAVAGETTLEYTPTWVVAAVCTVIVGISLGAERILHYAGKVPTSFPISIPLFRLFLWNIFVGGCFHWGKDVTPCSIWRKRTRSLCSKRYWKSRKVSPLFLFLSADAFCLFMGVLGAYFWFSVLCSTVVVVYAELMLLGFISLLLTVFQDTIAKICIPKRYSDDWLPCKKKKEDSSSSEESTSHFQTFYHFTSGGARRLLAEHSASPSYCAKRVTPNSSSSSILVLFINLPIPLSPIT